MAAAIKLQRHIGRRRAARFLAEGPNLVEAALRRGLVSEVFVTEAALDRFAALLVDAPVQVITERAAKALSDTVTPVGLVAVCRMPEVSLDEVLAGAPRLVAVAVETSEPGNAGTLIRLADAMGADAMILAGNSVDPFNGKCLRSSAGSIFGLPVVQAPDVDALMAALRAAGLQVLATTLDGETPLPDVDLTAPTAWLFGSEAHGLSPEIAAAADARVTIPMRGSAESLNVAAAAAICLYASAHALS
ncbi:TrmH family RNA methyltransferase [Mycolicibacterium fortuitum]|uniref:TrmH family RNA methyltransferase n=1 Tax=Mycolicibacterium fortuitum TaxID=1766 RepID=UPI00096C2725|nr:RNA methyltransferase [Mycolicibacterium fortuitum]OMC07705.1 RNA methyltransferase [Mycolicibacterium fortuitum]